VFRSFLDVILVVFVPVSNERQT